MLLLFRKAITFPIIFCLVLILCFIPYTYGQDTKADYELIIEKHTQQIKELEEKITKLENTVEVLEGKTAKEPEKNNPEENQSDANKSKPVTKENTVQTPLQAGEKKTIISKDKLAYEIALSSLKEEKFALSEQQFADFLITYPDSRYEENALFWYGETFYQRKLFFEAATKYLAAYKKYPKGAKAADTLLKLSLSLAHLNKNKEACNIVKKLFHEFPTIPAHLSKRALELKENLGCQEYK